MKIYAPVKDFNGLRNNVRFVNGVGETDNMLVVSWFQQHGYHIESESHVLNLVIEPTNDEVEKPDFESMNPNELRDWARANGYGGLIKNTRNKEKLIEILRG